MGMWARIGGTVWGKFILLGAGHFLGALLGFIATIIAVRALGDSGFAAVAIVLAIQGYAFSVVSFGTELYAVPQVARAHTQLAPFLAMTTMLRLAMSLPVFLFLVGLGLSGAFDDPTSLAILYVSTSVFFFVFSPVWASMALERPGILAAILLGGQVVILAMTLAANALDAPPWGFVLPKVIADLVMALAAFSWARRQSGPLQLGAGLRAAAKELSTIAPLGFSQLLRSAFVTLDVAILGLFAAAPEVGKFAVAFRIYMFIFMIGSRYFVIILPIFSQQIKAGIGGLTRELSLSFFRTIPVYLLGLAIVMIYAEPLLVLVFGPEFAAAAPALKILTVAATLNFIQQTYRQVLLAAHAHKTDFRNNAIAIMFKLPSIVILSLYFGMLGAAVAMVIGDLCLLLLQRRAAKRLLGATPQ